MNAKTLAITGALTLGLLAPAGTAVAASTDDHPNPLGGVLNIFGGHDGNDRKDGRNDRRKHVSTFKITSVVHSVDTDDRTITVGSADHRRTVKVAADAKIWRNGHRARLRNLNKGDDVKLWG